MQTNTRTRILCFHLNEHPISFIAECLHEYTKTCVCMCVYIYTSIQNPPRQRSISRIFRVLCVYTWACMHAYLRCAECPIFSFNWKSLETNHTAYSTMQTHTHTHTYTAQICTIYLCLYAIISLGYCIIIMLILLLLLIFLLLWLCGIHAKRDEASDERRRFLISIWVVREHCQMLYFGAI